MCRKIIILFLLVSVTNLSGQNKLVSNQLTQGLKSIFPEISKGYIDLNGNGKLDQDEDIDEKIPDSSIKDSLIQGKEILDFLIKHYIFIPLDSLNRVQKLLTDVQGEIPELVALQYKNVFEQTIHEKEKMEGEGPYITPAALREALNKIEEYISAMVLAYKKEGKDQESDYIKGRNSLFTMIEKGYPLPESLSEEDEEILVTIMIHTVLNENNSSKVNAAIKTLGKLRASSAVEYLITLLNKPDLRQISIKALGEIGSERALVRLMGELDTETQKNVKNELIRSIGKIGGRESINRLIAILKPDGDQTIDQDTRIAALGAMVDIANGGNPDKQMQNIFLEYLSMPDTRLRKLTIQGLSNYKNNTVNTRLITTLKDDSVSEVRIEAVKALNKLGLPGTVPSFVNLLRSKSTGELEKIALMDALGSNRDGQSALPYIIQNLGSKDERVRNSASKALISLYQYNPTAVIGSLGKTLVRCKDEATLTEGTGVLAALCDEASLPFLIPILSSPYPEVKKNVTWALYRIHSASNPRVFDELKRLVKSETEILPVRINAVRALGAIRYDSPRLKIWETLLNVLKMRDEKYSMLRFYAIRALGDLGSSEDQIIKTLLKIAVREKDKEIVQEALYVIQKAAAALEDTENELIRLFKREKDMDIRIRIIEALGDLRSPRAAEIASAALNADIGTMAKKRILYALAQVGGVEEIGLVIDSARDTLISSFILGMLEDWDQKVLLPVVNRRIKTETNPDIVDLLEELQAGIENRF